MNDQQSSSTVQQFVALVPHSVDIFEELQFVNLEKINATTWHADGVAGEPAFSYPQVGLARISTKVENCPSIDGQPPVVRTTYGNLEVTDMGKNLVDLSTLEGKTLIVSLPALGMAKSANNPLANQMVCPSRVVRLRSNTSQVLGCMELSW